MSMELHPLCTFFPRMPDAEFDALREDIKANGLRQMIVLHDGMILDGSHRYRACIEAGVKPRFTDYSGDNLLAYVRSVNLHRRHMTPGQQAVIVASMQDWAKTQGRGGDRKSDQSATLHFDSVADRAAQSGASERTQKMADKVVKADRDLAGQVGRGEVSLPAAVAQVEAKAPKKAKKASPPADTGTVATAPDKHDEAPGPVDRSSEDGEARAFTDQMLADYESTLAENVELQKILDADDKLAAAGERISQLTAEVRVLRSRVEGLMNEKNEAVSAAKSWRRKHDALEKRQKGGAA